MMQDFVVPESDRIATSQSSRSPALEQIVPPRPKQPTPQTPAQARGDELDVELKREELADRKRKAQQAQKDVSQIGYELRNVMDKAFHAKELSRKGWLTTGGGAPLGRAIGSVFGGNSATALKGALDTIASNVAFDRLQKMRDESPTGGALGSITERELDLLKSTIASLDPNLPDDEFQANMQQIVDTYGRVLNKIPGGRAMMIERGWLPKSSAGSKRPAKPQASKPRVVDFNDLPE
jgi:hypothetical protein